MLILARRKLELGPDHYTIAGSMSIPHDNTAT